MEHHWVGKPRDARKWHDEKRRHAPYYIAIGGATIVVGLLLVGWLWDGLNPGTRWRDAIMVLAFGGTVLTFGPLLYYISDKHTVYLVFPMREEWGQGRESTWSALTGYLTSRGVQFQRFHTWSSQAIVLGLDDGLRIMMQVSDIEYDKKRRTEVMVSIHRINERNVEWAEKLQWTLDEWPLLHDLKAGVDEELANEEGLMDV